MRSRGRHAIAGQQRLVMLNFEERRVGRPATSAKRTGGAGSYNRSNFQCSKMPEDNDPNRKHELIEVCEGWSSPGQKARSELCSSASRLSTARVGAGRQ
jgi:hypothetical protein